MRIVEYKLHEDNRVEINIFRDRNLKIRTYLAKVGDHRLARLAGIIEGFFEDGRPIENVFTRSDAISFSIGD